MAHVAMLANLCAEEMLRRSASSEEEYSTQRGVLHLGAEPRRGKMMSVPFAAGFLLRFLCIRLLVFGFFVCFSGSPDFPVAGRHCASLGCFFFFFFFLSGRRLRLRLSPSAFSFGFIFAFVFAFVWFRPSMGLLGHPHLVSSPSFLRSKSH